MWFLLCNKKEDCLLNTKYKIVDCMLLLLCSMFLCACSSKMHERSIPSVEEISITVPDAMYKGVPVAPADLQEAVVRELIRKLLDTKMDQINVKVGRSKIKFLLKKYKVFFPPPYFSMVRSHKKNDGAFEFVYDAKVYTSEISFPTSLQRRYRYYVDVKHKAATNEYDVTISLAKKVMEEEGLSIREKRFLKGVDEHFVDDFEQSAKSAIHKASSCEIETICTDKGSELVFLPKEEAVNVLVRRKGFTVYGDTVFYKGEAVATIKDDGDFARLSWRKDLKCTASFRGWDGDNEFDAQIEPLEDLRNYIISVSHLEEYFNKEGEFLSGNDAYEYALQFGKNSGFCNQKYEDKFLKRAADLGHVTSLYLYGFSFLRGKSNKSPEAAKGVELIRQAMELGECSAKASMADFYFYGVGVKRSESKALDMFDEMLEDDNIEPFCKGVAAFYLYRIYGNERSPRFSPEKAKKYLLQGAEDYRKARRVLAKSLEYGSRLFKRDRVEALKQYELLCKKSSKFRGKAAELLMTLNGGYKVYKKVSKYVRNFPEDRKEIAMLRDMAKTNLCARASYAQTMMHNLPEDEVKELLRLPSARDTRLQYADNKRCRAWQQFLLAANFLKDEEYKSTLTAAAKYSDVAAAHMGLWALSGRSSSYNKSTVDYEKAYKYFMQIEKRKKDSVAGCLAQEIKSLLQKKDSEGLEGLSYESNWFSDEDVLNHKINSGSKWICKGQ